MPTVNDDLARLQDDLLRKEARITKLEAELEQVKRKGKDAWDIFQSLSQSLSPFVTGVVLAIVGYFLTGAVNVALQKQQMQLSNVKEMKELLEKLGTKVACPHGNRVEGDTPQDRRNLGWRPLDEAPSDAAATVVCVFERDRRLLEYLNGLGIYPGAAVTIMTSNYDDTLTLRIQGKPVQLGKGAAAKVWVELAPASGAPKPENPASENKRSCPEALLPS